MNHNTFLYKLALFAFKTKHYLGLLNMLERICFSINII